MDAELLLLELSDLPVDARMKRAYELGRDSDAAPVLDAWENGDGWARRLALQSCYGSRDGARVVRMASDVSRSARNLARTIAAEVCDNAQLLEIFAPLNDKARRRFCVTLLKNRRRQAVDLLIESARERGEEWQSLIYLGSLALVERHFQAAFARANTFDWSRLARAFGVWTLEKLTARAVALSAPDDELLGHANAALQTAALGAPDAALQLVRALMAHQPLARIAIAPLLTQRPLELARLVLQSNDAIETRAPVKSIWGGLTIPSRRIDFARVAPRLPLDIVLELARRRPDVLSGLPQVLKKFSPAARGELYQTLNRAWRDDNGVLEAPIRLLPPPFRQDEARRHLELPSLRAEPQRWLPYAACLPYDEMRARVDPFLGDPDPDLRAAALGALIGALRFHFERADETLKMIEARRNEQDPVRGAMLQGLAALPPSRWQSAQLEALARIIQQGLDARDLSGITAHAMQALVVGILPFAPAWAARELAHLVKERGNLSFYVLESRLSDAQMLVVGAALLPVLRGWLDRERAPFISAFSALGRRLRAWDEGAALLIQATKNGPVGLACQAAALLRAHRRGDFALLVPQLLKLDKSWGTQAPVYSFIHRKAPNLLTTPMLGRDSIKGKFWTGKARFVLPLRRGFAHWTPDQQQLWSLTLEEVVRDAGRDLPGAISAIDALAALPDIEPTALLQLSSLENQRLALREAALRELSHLDAGGGILTLIEAMDDERARIAIYALRRTLLEMPAARALEILRDVPLQKVTVAKEVIRLLGDLNFAPALDFLLELAATDLHRDARVALNRALWEHLDDPRAWPILEDAARSNDAAVARMAARTTAPRLGDEAKTRLAALLAELLNYPDARVRLEVLANPSLSILEARGALRAGLFAVLASELPAEYRAAASAICNSAAARDANLAGQAMRQILPRRRALHEILETLGYQVAAQTYFGSVTRAIVDELATDPLALGERIRFGFIGLNENDWAQLIEGALGEGALHAEALGTAIDVLSNQYDPVRRNRAVAGQSFLMKRWQNADAPELRRLALAALIGRAQSGVGWSEARLRRLEKFRADSSTLVAAAAQWTFPGDEDDHSLDAELADMEMEDE